jgi:RNA polymerase sigma-70 factor (ECF subfamily)
VRVDSRARVSTPPFRPGSLEDFERLYRESHRKILATLIGILGDRAAAEDCAQETFARALRAWSGWRPEAPPEAWVHRIAVNVAVSARRRQTLHQLGDRLRHRGGAGAVVDPTDGTRGELLAALRRLPPKQAAVIVLRHLHGYTNREIAASLGVPERTVASRLATARARLRQDLRWEGAEVVVGGIDRPIATESGTSPGRRVVAEHAL